MQGYEYHECEMAKTPALLYGKRADILNAEGLLRTMGVRKIRLLGDDYQANVRTIRSKDTGDRKRPIEMFVTTDGSGVFVFPLGAKF